MLTRIFQQNSSSQNYITLLLDRLGDSVEPFTGQFTISEPVAGFENITSQPKLGVMKVPGLTDADQHFQVLSDKNKGIIGPDGNVIQTESIVPKAPSGQLVAVFDSGMQPNSITQCTKVQRAKDCERVYFFSGATFRVRRHLRPCAWC